VGLSEAATLFDAGLYFETHEVLEPFWMRAEGARREILQGLIQVAVGFQHLANGNLGGARALLREGAAKLARHDRRAGSATGAFAAQVTRGLDEIARLGAEAPARFDWSRVPPFPRGI
jgi:predicted metal-dependent hydrolase